MIIAVRIRGSVGVRHDIADTMMLMRLTRKMHAIILPEDPSTKGMIKKVKDLITWGPLSDDMLEALLKKRGRKSQDRKLTPDEVKAAMSEIKAGKKMIDAGIKPVFRLPPPSGGFKNSIKQHWPRGELGNRGEKINDLLKRMI